MLLQYHTGEAPVLHVEYVGLHEEYVSTRSTSPRGARLLAECVSTRGLQDVLCTQVSIKVLCWSVVSRVVAVVVLVVVASSCKYVSVRVSVFPVRVSSHVREFKTLRESVKYVRIQY